MSSLILSDDADKAFTGLFKHALRLLGLFEDVQDLLEGRNLGDDSLAQQEADFVDHHQLAGIGNRDRQLSISSFFEWNEVVTEHQVDRDLLEQIVMELKIVKVDELAAISTSGILRTFEFVGDTLSLIHISEPTRLLSI